MTDGTEREEESERYPVAELVDKGENDLADAIREAIGADPDERIEVVLPAFERNDGVEVEWYPEERMDIYSLCTASEEGLKELGLRKWEGDHWLLPAEWYDHIPEGTLLETINGEVMEFEHGKSDNDRRFGVLPYGIKRYVESDTSHPEEES